MKIVTGVIYFHYIAIRHSTSFNSYEKVKFPKLEYQICILKTIQSNYSGPSFSNLKHNILNLFSIDPFEGSG